MEPTTPPKSPHPPLSKPKRKKSKKSSATTSAKQSRAPSPHIPAGFVTGEDFIPFTVSDEEGPSSVSKKRKDKGKQRESSAESHLDSPREKNAEGKRRRDERAEEDKKRERSTTPPSTREWDRGKRPQRERSRERDHQRGEKRKHEDYDDDYANKKQRVDAASRKCPWVQNFDWEKCDNVADMLHQEVKSFVKWVSPTPVEDEIRALVVAQITAAIQSSFPGAQVLPFGSYQTKLYLPLGDIDLVILSDSMAYSNKVTVLNALASTMRRAGITSTKVTIISKARVPIIKFVTAHGRFNVDISLNQQSGIVSGQIINGFLQHMHPSGNGIALRALVLITKAFLSQRSMNEVFTGGLGSYSIVCLAISFLQMHPKIRRGEIDPEKNLRVLVMEFFEYYGLYFNYADVGISVRDGGTYFNKLHRGWMDPGRLQLLSIEDPAEPSNDYPRARTSSRASAQHLLAHTISYPLRPSLGQANSMHYTKAAIRHYGPAILQKR